MRVYVPNGQILEGFEEIDSVAAIRSKVARRLGTEEANVHLVADVHLVKDGDILCVDELTAVISTVPSWYPRGKYVHNGKEVLKIMREKRFGTRHAQDHSEANVEFEYADGSKTSQRLDAYGNTALENEVLASILIQQWGFTEHITRKCTSCAGYEDSMEGHSEKICMGGTSGEQFSEAVPAEDPDEWERTPDGERRKKRNGEQDTTSCAGRHCVTM